MQNVAAYVGLGSFAWLLLFQLMLAAGLPIGHLAWGGTNRVLPTGQRVASLVSAGIAVLALFTISETAGLRPGPLPAGWIGPILWALVALFALSIFANLFGARGAERLHGVPLASLCFGSCLILALG